MQLELPNWHRAGRADPRSRALAKHEPACSVGTLCIAKAGLDLGIANVLSLIKSPALTSSKSLAAMGHKLTCRCRSPETFMTNDDPLTAFVLCEPSVRMSDRQSAEGSYKFALDT